MIVPKGTPEPKIITVKIYSGESSPEVEAYLLALGRFVSAFSVAERQMFSLNATLMGVPLHVAQAILGSSARMRDLMDRTNRIIASRLLNEPTNALLQEMKTNLPIPFKQLSDINAVRNNLLHYGTDFSDEKDLKVSNSHLAYMPDKLTEIPISSEILEQMSQDLSLILAMLLRYCMFMHGISHGFTPWETLVDRKWKFKPSQLKPIV